MRIAGSEELPPDPDNIGMLDDGLHQSRPQTAAVVRKYIDVAQPRIGREIGDHPGKSDLLALCAVGAGDEMAVLDRTLLHRERTTNRPVRLS